MDNKQDNLGLIFAQCLLPFVFIVAFLFVAGNITKALLK